MSADPATRTRLARLLAEMAADVQALDARRGELVRLRTAAVSGGQSDDAVVLAAVNLHGYYTALETILERVARLLDEEVPEGAAWHHQLVLQMSVEVPGLRPALIPAETIRDVEELRRFRHFFRNAYVLCFDAAKILEHIERVERVHPPLERSLGSFRDHVTAVANAAG